MDWNCFKRTRELLQSDVDPLIEKPRLKDDLLRRPPFRFIHDIVKAIHDKTGFPTDLFDADNSDARKLSEDKQGKIAFLQRLIDTVSVHEYVEADPLEILAGLEPERTNNLLQTLGYVACRRCVVPPERDSTRLRPPSRRGTSERGNDRELVLNASESTDTEDMEWNREDDSSSCASRPLTARKALSSRKGRHEQPPLRPTSSRGPVFSAKTKPINSDTSSVPELNRTIENNGPSTDWTDTDDVHVNELTTEVEQDAEGLIKRCSNSSGRTSISNFPQFEIAVAKLSPLSLSLRRCFANLIDSRQPMLEEMQYWHEQTRIYTKRLKNTKPAEQFTAEDEPIHKILNQINQCQIQIRSLKHKVAQNDKTIQRMLQTIND